VVENAAPDRSLLKGIESFEVEDELRLSELESDIEVLLQTHFFDKARVSVENSGPTTRRAL
jgi:hypothetical protein